MEQATILFGDQSVAVRWLREAGIDAFQGLTGLDLLFGGQGNPLMRYIELQQAGFLG